MTKRFYVELQFDTNNAAVTKDVVYDALNYLAYDRDGYRVSVTVDEEDRG